jgi:hypothetical protein
MKKLFYDGKVSGGAGDWTPDSEVAFSLPAVGITF